MGISIEFWIRLTFLLDEIGLCWSGLNLVFLLLSGNESSLKKVHAIIIIFKCSWTLQGPTLIWPGALSLSENPKESQADSSTWTNRVHVSAAGLGSLEPTPGCGAAVKMQICLVRGPPCASSRGDRGNE